MHSSFQSTHPLRDATLRASTDTMAQVFFNPRTPCGMRLRHAANGSTSSFFQSTHLLRDATADPPDWFAACNFQSTHPLRDATQHRRRRVSDSRVFNPRTPCGMRPQIIPLSVHLTSTCRIILLLPMRLITQTAKLMCFLVRRPRKNTYSFIFALQKKRTFWVI